ncbi:MAG: SulP family inorganic anion transporter [Candidatus Electrothrix aestuarii]|uniref:SulP family inorganic anion transporter n=1 Tax=Candidatus Electrothrix aestuarii TaxID=3062594 RepID=A0AAU8LYK6_9BACT|nr:SulP family inorganic anion transporter [Candidatus Electrothrix aestuarii]
MKRFKFIEHKRGSIKDDVLSGLTVAIALVPEAVAFAFIAGISPIVGLYGAFMMGLVTSVIGGRPGMISGATGATAVVMVSLVKTGAEMGGEGAGLQYLFVTLLLVGVLQMLAGVFRFGKFVRLIPHPVMMGFVNGLAIVIFLAQLEMFKAGGAWMQGTPLYTMLGLVGLTMAILYLLPKFTTKVPAALVAIITVALLVIFTGIETETVLSFVQAKGGEGIKAGLPVFHVPAVPFTLETLYFIFPYAAIIASVGLIESLMTLNLIDELTNTHGNANKESIAQGVANMVNGFLGGMGGCAMIGQSIINIKSGGRGRLSGIVAALSLLMFILFGSTYIGMIPVAALVGLMFMVVLGTFAWSTFGVLDKIPLSDALVILLVTVLTVVFDLAIAVLAGVVVSALVFAWENAIRIRARKRIDENGVKHYEIFGPLFFGSVQMFNSKFDVENDPDEIIIDFKESRVADHSGIEAINKLAQKYEQAGKNISLQHLSPDCRKLIHKADKLIQVDIIEDPEYTVAVDGFEDYSPV